MGNVEVKTLATSCTALSSNPLFFAKDKYCLTRYTRVQWAGSGAVFLFNHAGSRWGFRLIGKKWKPAPTAAPFRQDWTPLCYTIVMNVIILKKQNVSFYLDASLGFPGQTKLIGQYSSSDGAAIVAAPAHEHDTKLGHMALCAECKLSAVGCHLEVWRGTVVTDKLGRCLIRIFLNVSKITILYLYCKKLSCLKSTVHIIIYRSWSGLLCNINYTFPFFSLEKIILFYSVALLAKCLTVCDSCTPNILLA